MKVTVTMSTTKGFYAEEEREVSDLVQAVDVQHEIIDGLADEVHGTSIADWTEIQVKITR
jgi:hypothetical protein